MPDVTGTSTAGRQLVIPLSTFSAAQIQLIFPGFPNSTPRKVGWAYITVLPPATPSCQRLLYQGPVYIPGNLYLFPANYTFNGVSYALIVQWNIPNLSWLARYS